MNRSSLSVETRPAEQMSWGRYFRFPQLTLPIRNREDASAIASEAGGRTILPHGEGRSYGDVCLNEGGVCIDTANLNRVISFDRQTGVLTCEAGCTIAQLLDLIVPQGWFVPVTPGTKFVTVGGAVANDVHGKNHHCSGTFGCHVSEMEIWRSGEGLLRLTSGDPLFGATIGGLGLTGLILTLTFQCIRIQSSLIEKQSVKMRGLDDFFTLSDESDTDFTYTVAWIDCLAPPRALGRGEFYRGNHASGGSLEYRPKRKLVIPFELPIRAINELSIRSFNCLYRSRQRGRLKESMVGIDPFFFPLDGLEHWNRLYGRTGLFQFQCCTPPDRQDAIKALLESISAAGTGSPLVVLKKFGSVESPGMLSFPREGYTLCIDFPNTGDRVQRLLKKLETITLDCGGRLYPAKDSVMSRESFHRSYPRFPEFESFMDPAFSSSFIRRVS